MRRECGCKSEIVLNLTCSWGQLLVQARWRPHCRRPSPFPQDIQCILPYMCNSTLKSLFVEIIIEYEYDFPDRHLEHKQRPASAQAWLHWISSSSSSYSTGELGSVSKVQKFVLLPSGFVKVKILTSPFLRQLELSDFKNGLISLGVLSPFLRRNTQTAGLPLLPARPN